MDTFEALAEKLDEWYKALGPGEEWHGTTAFQQVRVEWTQLLKAHGERKVMNAVRKHTNLVVQRGRLLAELQHLPR